MALLQDNVLALRGDAASALRQLEESEAGAAAAVATLRDLDKAKQRMEAACTTLKVSALCCLCFGGGEGGQRRGKPCRLPNSCERK